MRPTVTCALAGAAIGLAPTPSSAQDPPPIQSVGVVLSGGSAKGLAHIGVLRVLQEYGVPVDIVTGTSMGAIVGGLYAAGYTTDELETVALDADWGSLFGGVGGPPKPPTANWAEGQHTLTLPLGKSGPTLPSNLVTGQAIHQLLARLTWRAHGVRDFSKLSVSFAAIAADLETGEAVAVTSGSLAEAIQASMALPAIFEPVAIGDRVFVDGGVSRNLPAQDALELGASVLICSDVSEPLVPADSLGNALKTMTQVMSFAGNQSNEEQRALCDVTIRMQFSRGAGLQFDRAGDWIALGDSAARASIDEVLAVTRQSTAAERSVFTPLPQRVSVASAAVTSDNVDTEPSAMLSALGLRLPDTLTALQLDDALSRAYRTGRYQSVHYTTEAGATTASAGEDRALMIRTERADPARLGIGIRYESRYKASLLFTGMFYGLGNATSDMRIDVRLGQQVRLAGDYRYRSSPGVAFMAGGGIGFTRMPFDVFRDGAAVAELRFESFTADAFAGLAIGPRFNVAFKVHAEHMLGKTAIAPITADTTNTFYTIGGQLSGNWYGREYFPMRGAAILAKSEFANRAIGSGGTFSHHVIDLHGHLPVHRQVSIKARATVGGSSGSDLPLDYLFTLGGANPQFLWPDRQFPFFGLANQELLGRAMQRFSVAVQVKPVKQVFLALEWNTGTTYDEWAFNPDEYSNAYGLTLGMETLLGGIALRFGGLGFKEAPIIQIDLGSRF